jgi:DNA-binding protein HU-beta
VNKQEFIEDLAERCDFSKAEAGRALDAILDSLTEELADGEEIRFTGFGTFLSQRRKARDGVNPQDPSQKIRIRAARVPKFRPGTALREATSEAPTDEAADSRSNEQGASRRSADPTGWMPLGNRA